MNKTKLFAAAGLAAALILTASVTNSKGALVQGAAATALIYFGGPLAEQFGAKVAALIPVG